jgi:feruloyl-CoA synthase
MPPHAFRPAPYLPKRIHISRRSDGAWLLRNENPLRQVQPHMLAPLAEWAGRDARRLALAERAGQDWRRLTYGELWAQVQATGEGLAGLGLGRGDALMILSRNSIAHAITAYGALAAGAAIAPVTPAYSLIAKDFDRLRDAHDLLRPAGFFVEDGAQFQKALDALAPGSRPVIYARNAPQGVNAIGLDELLAHRPGARVAARLNAITTRDHAKYLLTSGSTGRPKAVICTHGGVASNVAMIRSIYDEAAEENLYAGQQVTVNFAPWSHSLGANAILHNWLNLGGALYIDWGAPTAERFGETLRNLREVSSTYFSSVPAAWALLVTELEQDPALAEVFFRRLRIMAYGGAAMGQDIGDRIQQVAVRTIGERITFYSGYGSTETGPTASNIHWMNDRMGLIGMPVPGCDMKLSPVGDKLECRVRGPNVSPGYLNDQQLTADAFDDEGYYKLGDAVKFIDLEDPAAGIAFDGRLSEEFKLLSGVWVAAGAVRLGVVAAGDGLFADAVVCGINEPCIGVLLFLDLQRARQAAGHGGELASLARDARVLAAAQDAIARYNERHPNAAARIARAVLLADSPSLESGELTDKGYLNQSRARQLRADTAARLYTQPLADDVIVPA